MKNEKDIFDFIMELPFLRIFNPIYKAHKEILLYLFFGGLTFLISVLSYAFLNITCRMNELVANIFSWSIAVLFAYITNRNLVFKTIPEEKKAAVKQMFDFFGARVVTLIIEEIILLIFITMLGYNSLIVKITAQIIVIIINYFFSKLYIFK